MTLKSPWRLNNIGRRMNEAVRIFEGRIIELLREKGHAELTVAHVNLTRNLDEDGTRLTELARRAALSKQAMSELVAQVDIGAVIACGASVGPKPAAAPVTRRLSHFRIRAHPVACARSSLY